MVNFTRSALQTIALLLHLVQNAKYIPTYSLLALMELCLQAALQVWCCQPLQGLHPPRRQPPLQRPRHLPARLLPRRLSSRILLSGGAIGGIIIESVAGSLAAAGMGLYFFRRHKRAKTARNAPASSQMGMTAASPAPISYYGRDSYITSAFPTPPPTWVHAPSKPPQELDAVSPDVHRAEHQPASHTAETAASGVGPQGTD